MPTCKAIKVIMEAFLEFKCSSKHFFKKEDNNEDKEMTSLTSDEKENLQSLNIEHPQIYKEFDDEFLCNMPIKQETEEPYTNTLDNTGFGQESFKLMKVSSGNLLSYKEPSDKGIKKEITCLGDIKKEDLDESVAFDSNINLVNRNGVKFELTEDYNINVDEVILKDEVIFSEGNLMEDANSFRSNIIEETESQSDKVGKCPATVKYKKFACQKCGYKTANKRLLQKHIQHEVNCYKKIKKFECHECDYKATTKRNLQKHIQRRHGICDIIFKCCKCEFTTKFQNRLWTHEKIKHHEDSQLSECLHCGYKTTNRGYLMTHIRIQHSKIMHQCSLCDYTATSQFYIKRHVRRTHPTEENPLKLIKCSYCDFSSVYSTSVRKHELLKHDVSSDILTCSQCSYKTKWKGDLTTHITRSHGTDYFNCDICEYRSRWKNCLTRHMKRTHSQVKGKYIQCKICGYKTLYRYDLILHRQKEHKQTHESGDYFTCSKCSFKTLWKGNLRRHIKQHHEKKAVKQGGNKKI